jgi:hypothetical protein
MWMKITSLSLNRKNKPTVFMGWLTFFPVLGVISGYFGWFSLRGESFGVALLCEVTLSLVFTEFYIEIGFLLLYRYLINSLKRRFWTDGSQMLHTLLLQFKFNPVYTVWVNCSEDFASHKVMWTLKQRRAHRHDNLTSIFNKVLPFL